MRTRVLVLGAGFGGLELTTILSDTFGDAIDIVLVDKGDTFVFGFSKLDVMFGRQTADAVRHPYKTSSKAVSGSCSPRCDRSTRLRVVRSPTMELRGGRAGGRARCGPRPGRDPRPCGRRHMSSTRSPAPSRCAMCFQRSRRARRSSASRGNRSNALRLPARPRCCCTITSRRAAAARPQKSPWSCLSARRFPRRPTRRRHPRGICRAGHPVREGQPGQGARPEAESGAVRATARRSRTNFFSAYPCTAYLRSSSSPGLLRTVWLGTGQQEDARDELPGVYAVGDVNGVGTPKAGVFAEGAARVVAAAITAQLKEERHPILQGAGFLLRRVWPRSGRACGRQLPGWTQTHGHVPGAIGGSGGRESAFRIEPAETVVRAGDCSLTG